MDFLTMKERVRARAGTPAGDTWQDDATIDGFVNDAIREFETEHNWPWAQEITDFTYGAGLEFVLLSTVAPTAEEIRDVLVQRPDLSAFDPVEQAAPREVLRSATTTSGRPQTWAFYADRFMLTPRPPNDLTVRLLHSRPVPVLVNDTDEYVAPEKYHPAVIVLAAAKIADRDDDQLKVQRLLLAYERSLVRLNKKISKGDRPRSFNIRPGSWYDAL